MGNPFPLITSPVVLFFESLRDASMSAHSFSLDILTNDFLKSLLPIGLNQIVPRQTALSILSRQLVRASILEILASTASKVPTCLLGQVQKEKWGIGQWFVGGLDDADLGEEGSAGREKDHEPERGSSETVKEKVVDGRGVGEVTIARYI